MSQFREVTADDRLSFSVGYNDGVGFFGLKRDNKCGYIFGIARDATLIPVDASNVVECTTPGRATKTPVYDKGVQDSVEGYLKRVGMLTTAEGSDGCDVYELAELRMKFIVNSTDGIDNLGFFLGSSFLSRGVSNTRVVTVSADAEIAQHTTLDMFAEKYMLCSMNDVAPGVSMFPEFKGGNAEFHPLELSRTKAVRVRCYVGIDDPVDTHRKIACGIDCLVCVK